MVKRRVFDDEKHIHFVTFSCYRRRKYLAPDQAKRIVIGHLGSKLSKRDGLCLGFFIMPDHVHALVWVPEKRQLSPFMNEWKEQSSHALKQSSPDCSSIGVRSTRGNSVILCRALLALSCQPLAASQPRS